MIKNIVQCLLLSAGIVFIMSEKSFSQVKTDSTSWHKNFSIGLYNFNYLRDYEYFSPIMEGYTLYGSIVQPTIIYKPSNHVSFKGGIFVQQNFGDDSIRVRPTFLLSVRNSSTDFSFGNYRNEYGHQLIEPLWFDDNLVTENIENGFNLKQKFSHLELDNWIDWNRAIINGSDFQEKVFGGLTSNILLLKNSSKKITFPIQVCIQHTGGQINKPDTSFFVTTILNADAGIKSILKNKNSNIFISEFSAEAYYVFYKEFSPNPHLQFTEGNGIWGLLKLKSNVGAGIELAYWQGNNFISPKGNSLMQSVSSVYPKSDYTEKERQLIFFTLKYEKDILPHLHFLFSGETYYDFKNKLFEYGIHLQLIYAINEDMHLPIGKFRPRKIIDP